MAFRATGAGLAEHANNAYKAGWVYWYGTYGNPCTLDKYKSKKKQYPSHYGSSRTDRYMQHIKEGKTCADCVGMIKHYFWSGGDINAKPVYKANGCPDKSANGMYQLCEETGPIAVIPEIPGLVVWTDGHIGVYIGGGKVIEERGFDYGCVMTDVHKRTWKRWGKLPASMIAYSGEAVTETPTIKRGDIGPYVEKAQLLMLKWDENALPDYGADADFGEETEVWAKKFQTAHGLTADGVISEKTWAELLKYEKAEAPEEEPDDGTEPEQPSVTPAPAGMVKVTGDSVYLWDGHPDAGGKKDVVVHKGDELPVLDARGYIPVVHNGLVKWINSKYAKEI